VSVGYLKPDPGERLHQFVVGVLPVAAYLADRTAPVWAAVGLSLAAMLSRRLAVVSRLYDYIKHRPDEPAQPFFHDGVRRFDEAARAVLLGLGLAAILAGRPIGWLAVLAASSEAILASTTGFSFSTVLYAVARGALKALERWNPFSRTRRNGPPEAARPRITPSPRPDRGRQYRRHCSGREPEEVAPPNLRDLTHGFHPRNQHKISSFIAQNFLRHHT